MVSVTQFISSIENWSDADRRHKRFGMRKILLILLIIGMCGGCTVLDFSCSTGEYGPRARVVFGVGSALSDQTLEDLSRLCSAEVE